jgi:hypothetical protein
MVRPTRHGVQDADIKWVTFCTPTPFGKPGMQLGPISSQHHMIAQKKFSSSPICDML